MDGFNLDIFKKNGYEMIDLVCRNYENIEKMPIQPNVEPGFLRQKLDESPPIKPEDPSKIFNSLEKDIFPGITQWQHPSFFAYYPSTSSYPAVLADIFVSSFNTPGFSWYSSPSTTEVENIVCDWIVQMIDLPKKFLLKNKGGGGGINSASDGYFLSVHYAKLKKLKELNIDNFDPKIFNLVAYFPEHSKIWSRKALFLKEIKHQRILPMYFDKEIGNYVINVNEFEELVKKDIENNLIPFWFGASIGSTPVCSCDNLELIGPICKKYNIFLSVDAAYTGPFWCCPELRVKGLELVDALLINYSKNGLIGMIGSFMFLDDKENFMRNMRANNLNDFVTTKNKFTDNYDIVDYKDWTVGFGRKSNALKLLFCIRFFGIEGYQKYYRYLIEISDYCEKLIEKNDKFELICKRKYTLICFRVIKNNEGVKIDEDKLNDVNTKLKEMINEKNDDGFISLGQMGNSIFLRVAIGNFKTTKEHIDKFIEKVNNCAEKI